MISSEDKNKIYWYVMRDLKRSNAKLPVYKHLEKEHIEVFTPMKWCLKIKNGQRIRVEVPFIQDLLFVYDTREVIDPIILKTPTLQYRYQKGGGYCNPMTIADTDMERFIRAVGSSDSPRYYLPKEIRPKMYGRKIRILGGALDGYEGRLLIDLPNVFSVGVEVVKPAIEFRVFNKRSIQLEGWGSYAPRNFLGTGYPCSLVLMYGEFRYYFKEVFKRFFCGVHVGGGVYRLNKDILPIFGYLTDPNSIQVGLNLIVGLTAGYQFTFNKHLGLEIVAGYGRQFSTYEGYTHRDSGTVAYRSLNGSAEY